MSTAAIPAPSTPPLSQASRVVDTFVAPSKTFSDINRSASWWLPYLIIALVSWAFVFTVDKKVGFDKVSENQVKMNTKAQERLDQLTPEQREHQMEISTKFTKIISYAFPVLTLAINAIMALILWGSYSFGAGAQVSFAKSMAVVMYSNMVGIVKALLAMVTLFAGADTDTFTFQNPVATNLGFLIDPMQHKVLYTLGSSLDLINFWIMALVAIGFTYVCKVKKGTSFAIVFGWWALVTAVSVGAAALF